MTNKLLFIKKKNQIKLRYDSNCNFGQLNKRNKISITAADSRDRQTDRKQTRHKKHLLESGEHLVGKLRHIVYATSYIPQSSHMIESNSRVVT